MSGLGPAACWLAHKRIESWSRLAKERVGAVRKSHDKGDGSKSTSINMSTDSNNDSIASTEVIPFNVIRFESIFSHLSCKLLFAMQRKKENFIKL